MDAPVLLAPTAETPARGSDVTLRWQPVEGAQGYRVQVAADEDFTTLVVDSRLGPVTSLHVRGIVPGDDGRLFWRVAAKGGDFAEASFRCERDGKGASSGTSSRTFLLVGTVLALVVGLLAFWLTPTATETARRQAIADSLAADSTAAPAAVPAAPAATDSAAADTSAH